MTFTLKNIYENPNMLARKLGYMPLSVTETGEYNLVRKLTGNFYPRFHIYLKTGNETGEYIFSLHLDQKKASYEGSHAHSGEYDDDTVKEEAERIKQTLTINS